MSLEIDIEKISEVLLADGWHKVSPVGDGRSSFGSDAYEFLQPNPATQLNSATQPNEPQRPAGGQSQDNHRADQQKSPASPAGARWTEADGSRVFCPVTSILAVKYAGQNKQQETHRNL
jgi:hypothetical protein